MPRERKTEYDKDFYQWTNTQAKLLKKGEFDKLDMVNLVDEVESLGAQIFSEFRQHLESILLYMLLQKYMPERISDLTRYNISTSKFMLESLLENSPSIRRRLYGKKASSYRCACNEFALDTQLFDLELPEKCP